MMEQPDRILRVVIRAEAVRADEFGQAVGLMGRRHFAAAAHFRQAHLEAAPGKLPGGFASGEAAADYVDIMGHRARPNACQWLPARPSVAECRAAPFPNIAHGYSPA